jgi:uncharacterized protein YukE
METQLSPQQMEILSDLVQHLSCEAVGSSDPAVGSENYYRLRFEAAEARYGRMKALVCASLERQAQLQNERGALEISGLMKNLRIQGVDNPTVLWNTLNELKAAREEMGKLKEMNRCLRHNTSMVEMQPPLATREYRAESELQIARQKIGALELELVRMSDQQFEIEERIREHQDVIDNLLGHEHTATEPVHPRYHPINTCTSAACQNYARRLRNGLRQAVADAYVRDRCVRIHGYFQRVVRPMEDLRAEKDEQIHDLRSRLARLECATLRSADDVAAVNEDMAKQVYEMEKLKADADVVRAEHQALQTRKQELASEIRGLQGSVQEARDVLEESNEKRSLCKAEMQCLEKERERVERVWERVQGFLDGRMAAEYDQMRRECQTLEHRLEAMRKDVQRADGGEKMDEDDAPIKRVGKVVFITCRCGQSVRAEEIGRHILSVHRATGSGTVIPCPDGCGFFANERRELVEHVRGSECAERVRAIKRLKESRKGV